jgi:hypothetical protein
VDVAAAHPGSVPPVRLVVPHEGPGAPLPGLRLRRDRLVSAAGSGFRGLRARRTSDPVSHHCLAWPTCQNPPLQGTPGRQERP